MKTIELDIPTRLVASSALGGQRGTLDALAVPHDILKKIKLTEEETSSFSIQIPNGCPRCGNVVDQDALQGMAGKVSKTVDFEKEEVKVFLRVLKSFEQFGQGDYPYVYELVKVLEA